MKEYRTIVVINQEIYTKIELYRQFLEKSEFESNLDHARFVPDNSVEGIPSTELNNVENFIYLFGILNKEQYKTYLDDIEKARKRYQNGKHYMLFCQDKCQEDTYDESCDADPMVPQTFSVGILDEEIPEDDNKELKEELNCIKLLVLALAICKFNETKSSAFFKSNYMCSDVQLDYKNIYYAVMHTLCDYADQINERERKIVINKETIAMLKEKKESICEANFDDSIIGTGVIINSSFSEYKDTEVLQRDMERAYREGCELMDKSIKHHIDVARRALAIEEEHEEELVPEIKNGQIELRNVGDSQYFQRYMRITEAETPEEKRKVAQPADLLKKPVEVAEVDSVKLRALLPLARNFEKHKKFNPLATVLSALVFSLLFLVVSGVIYFVRYKTMGLNGVTQQDLVNVLIIPAILLLLTGITGIVVQFIRHLYSKSVFKKAHESLISFINGRKDVCEKIKDYINKYLTVYYNYHIKHTRIEKLTEENIILEDEIKEIKKNVSPSNDIAEMICLFNGETIEIPRLIPSGDGDDALSLRKHLEKNIETKTEISCSDSAIKTTTPWAKKISYSVGNMNSGGGR